jgi:hypothetical protein
MSLKQPAHILLSIPFISLHTYEPVFLSGKNNGSQYPFDHFVKSTSAKEKNTGKNQEAVAESLK